jgi:hypothetical protein
MLHKNTIPFGILMGLILPILAIVIFEGFLPDVIINHRRGLQYLVTVGLNLLLLRYFASKRSDKTIKGIILVTFVFMFWVFLYRFKI